MRDVHSIAIVLAVFDILIVEASCVDWSFAQNQLVTLPRSFPVEGEVPNLLSPNLLRTC